MSPVVRAATPSDTTGVISVFHASRAHALSWLPVLHTPDEDEWFFGGQLRDHPSWVATVDGEVVGFAISSPGWLDHLYLRPDWIGTGLGSELLQRAKDANPDGLDLWVFTRNHPAREFYLKRGFVEIEHTDGQRNEEKEPDVLMRWLPS